MQPYVIKQGDYLAKLADQLGFDADTVWGDQSNAQLQQLRPNPNILFAGDVLYIPNQMGPPPAPQSLTPGTTNSFVTNAAATVSVSITFTDPGLASQAYSVPELPQLTGLTTDANGTATLEVPVSQDSFTIAFAAAGVTLLYQMGYLDPITTLSGIFQRLQHLGFLPSNINPFPLDPDMIRAGLLALKAAQPSADGGPPPSSAPPSSAAPASSPPASSPPGSSPTGSPSGGSTASPSQSPPVPAAGWTPMDSSSGSTPPPSGSAASPASSPTPASEPTPGSTPSPASGPGASPGSQPPPSATDGASAPASGPASSPGGSDSAPPSSEDPVEEAEDNAGLNDDGTLDDATSQLLLAAHGG
jgi:hypothetical protein